jgi:mannose-6-phosphate isomerase-like protein (cupin superfamily)
MYLINKKDQHRIEVFEGVIRHTLACGKDVLMAHKHSYEQVTTILEGEQKIIIEGEGGNEELIVKTGDTYIVPANFSHEQITLKEAVTIDAWSLAP